MSSIMATMKLDISKQLARLMRERRLSQSALSRATGVPQPTINSVVRIANFFGVTPESLYGPPLKKPAGEDSVSVEELYERIQSLSDSDRAALFAKVAEKLS